MTSGILPREGLTLEALFAPIKHIVLQPAVTGALLVAALYYPDRLAELLPPRFQYLIRSARALSWLKTFLALGIARTVNAKLSQLVLNNWTSDSWRGQGHEIVLVTGGSSGIGELLVHRMARSSKTVIAVDLNPPKRPLRRFPITSFS